MKLMKQNDMHSSGKFPRLPLSGCLYGLLGLLICVLCLSVGREANAAKSFRISVLTMGTIRKAALEGFMEAMAENETLDNIKIIYTIKDAAGNLGNLTPLAEEIAADKPDLIVAAGGVEADALKIATAENRIPVVYLVVSSSVSRGLAESMQRPGGNLTGIDTNDTALTGKRLWYITKLFPQARRVLCFNFANIAPSADSIKIAREMAPQLGLQLTVIDVDSAKDLVTAAATVTREKTDAILLNPCAPVTQAIKTVLLPLSLEKKIPILGYSEGDVQKGAIASYGPSRYGIGKQGARLAIKLLHGADPAVVPIETPEALELIINRHMAERLGLEIPNRIWRIADSVVSIEQ